MCVCTVTPGTIRPRCYNDITTMAKYLYTTCTRDGSTAVPYINMADQLLGLVPRRRSRRVCVFLITAVTTVPTHHKVAEWDSLVCVVYIHINRGWKLTCGVCENVCVSMCVFKKKVKVSGV